jgi:leader peptidase (prepilin peptidase)/N-methyltransferase
LIWLLIALAVLDAEHLWLPDLLTISGIVIGYVWFFVQVAIISHGLHDPDGPWKEAAEWFLGVLAAAGLILLIRWIYKLIRHREGLGLGDAKLMAMLAAWLGLPGALLSFAIGVVLGSLVAIVLLVRHPKHITKETWAAVKLPLGTFLCIGGIVSSLWGQPIIAAYMRWAGF